MQTVARYSWLFVLALFLLIELIVDPRGEFCLNDDWAYARAIYHYQNSGTIRFSFWQGFPDLMRFFIGVLTTELFGFSFTALRFISVFSLAAIIFLLNLNLKELKIKQELHFPVLLLIVFNPLTIALSNTYLSDVFQLLLILISFHFALLFRNRKRTAYLIAFILITLISTLNRQICIIIPLIFGLILFRSEKNKLIPVSPFLINLAALLLYDHFGKINGILPGNYYIQFDNILHTFTDPRFSSVKSITYYFASSTTCLGLFILPFTLANLRFHFTKIKVSFLSKLALIFYLILILIKIFFSGNVLPFTGNIFYHLGIGPLIMTGYNTDDPASLSTIATIVWSLLSLAGGISFFAAIHSILISGSGFLRSFLLLLFIFYLLPLCFSYANDRYLIVILPFLVMAYCYSFDFKFDLSPYLITFTFLFFFAVAGTHDYMNINRGRAKAAAHLLNDLKAKPYRIDGGFEFNGWFLADPVKNYIPSHQGRWWWIDKDDHIISPVIRNNYFIESEYPLNTWIPGNLNTIYVLQKQNDGNNTK